MTSSTTRCRHGLAACGLLLSIGAGAVVAGRTPTEIVERQAYLMGTRVVLAVRSDDRASGLSLLDRMLESLEASEAELSTWRDDSVLSAFNQSSVGVPFGLSRHLCAAFLELARWHRETRGAFDPAIGALVDAWGLRGTGRIPGPAELSRARARSGLSRLSFDPVDCSVTRRGIVTLDAGAFGKGLALDRAGAIAARAGASRGWMMDFGGQVAVESPVSAPWPVAIAHPAWRHRPALEVALSTGSLAVSGGSERDLELDGMRLGHILDPRVGRPVSRDVSVAVWHPRGLVADVLSTALYVMGADAGVAWADAYGIAACFLRPRSSRGSDASGIDLVPSSVFRERFL